MFKSKIKKFMSLVVVLFTVFSLFTYSYAEKPKYYLGCSYRTGTNNGYDDCQAIQRNDVHFGNRLGRFQISGFTSKTIMGDDENGYDLYFLKTVGDEVKLSFLLEENIDQLFHNPDLIICEDKNGWNNYFEIPKTQFGRGTLIIQYMDLDGNFHDPVIYTDYLSGVKHKAETDVYVFEEGYYEVELDYEISKDKLIGSKKYDYCMFFSFWVINGNSMTYIFDSKTGSELFNGDSTDNGFVIDFAGTKTLDVLVQRDVESNNGWDTRFNRAASDGEVFVSPGRYTIDVMNLFTGANTIKQIFVNTQSGSEESAEEIVEVEAETQIPIFEDEYLDGEYYCPACSSILDYQYGFDPSVGYWTCADCGQFLFDGENEGIYPGEKYPDVMWYCDKCEAWLNLQKGFVDTEGTWKCTECGYVNSISDGDIIR